MSPADATPKQSCRKKIWVSILAVVALVAGVWFFTQPVKDPIYNGKKLSVWLQLLRTPERANAEAAIKALGSEAVPFLVAQLSSRESGFKKRYRDFYVSKSLSWYHSCLPRPAAEVTAWDRGCAANELGNLGPIAAPAIPHLLAALDDETGVRWNAGFALYQIGEPTARFLPEIVRKLDNQDASTAQRLVNIITKLGKDRPDIVPVLVAGLRENDKVKIRVLQILPTFGNRAKAAERDINPFLNATNVELRAAALFALWDLYPERHLELFDKLTDVATSPDLMIRSKVLAKLVRMQPFTIPAANLLDSMCGNTTAGSWGIAADLGRRGQEVSNAVPVILPWLKSSEPRVAGKTAEALGKIATATPEVIAALQVAQKHEYSMVSDAATEALATLQSPPKP